jgi:hypothetical protein
MDMADIYYVSFGGGVNSVAMVLWMLDNNQPITACHFVDTGCEYPETLEYVEMFSREVYPIKTINSADYNKGRNLLDKCHQYSMVPSTTIRWCTSDWKIKPLHAAMIKPCFAVIGIAYDEKKRCRLSKDFGIENYYPLVENKITRAGCIKIISDHGLPVPPKSGCWLCPFQPISAVKRMRDKHPELLCQLRALEDASVLRRLNNPKNKTGRTGYWHATNKPLSAILNDNEGLLFDELQQQPCMCGR